MSRKTGLKLVGSGHLVTQEEQEQQTRELDDSRIDDTVR
jgi:hypothetical protein